MNMSVPYYDEILYKQRGTKIAPDHLNLEGDRNVSVVFHDKSLLRNKASLMSFTLILVSLWVIWFLTKCPSLGTNFLKKGRML